MHFRFADYNPRPLFALTVEEGSADQCMLGLHNDKLQILLYEELAHIFELAYAKRGFVHWYHKHGQEDEDFNEAREDLAATIHDWEWEGHEGYYGDEEEME